MLIETRTNRRMRMITTERLIEDERQFHRKLVCNKYARLAKRTTYHANRNTHTRCPSNLYTIDAYIDGKIDRCVATVSYYGGEKTGRWKAFIRHNGLDKVLHVGVKRCGVPSEGGALALWQNIDYSD